MGTVLQWPCLMLCSVLSRGAAGEELMLFGTGSLREAMTQVAPTTRPPSDLPSGMVNLLTILPEP